ncbi:MAG: NTP transferase domain-containing protein [Chthoniobacterales bacterium]
MGNIGAVILAAGESSRLGQPKQLLRFHGETLIRRAVRAAAADCDPVIVVVGEIGESIRSELDIRDSRISSCPPLENERRTRGGGGSGGSACSGGGSGGGIQVSDVIVVENAEWRNGVGTSIRRGLGQLANSVEAVVLLACDQPFVDATVIAQLVAAHEETGKPIVASSYANTLGVPALFDRTCLEALLSLPDDSGAKMLIANRPGDVASIRFDEGAIDIDTREDFARLTAKSE